MPRVKGGPTGRHRHKKILKLAGGARGSRGKHFRAANETVMKGLAYAYRDRRNRKRDMRSLWIVRINAAARQRGMSYSRFMNQLRQSHIDLDRKMLADLAVREPEVFDRIIEEVKAPTT